MHGSVVVSHNTVHKRSKVILLEFGKVEVRETTQGRQLNPEKLWDVPL